MPKPPVPARFHGIHESSTRGHLATIDERGPPRSNPVWILWNGEYVLLSVKPDTKKYENLRRNPHLAFSFPDVSQPGHYVELRGEVISFELYEVLTFVNLLAHTYTGADFTDGYAGEHRYKLTIKVNSWTGQ